MRLSSRGKMNPGKPPEEHLANVRDVDSGKMHVDLIRTMNPCHSLPTDNRQPQIHGESGIDTATRRTRIHQGALDPSVGLKVRVEADLNT